MRDIAIQKSKGHGIAHTKCVHAGNLKKLFNEMDSPLDNIQLNLAVAHFKALAKIMI